MKDDPGKAKDRQRATRALCRAVIRGDAEKAQEQIDSGADLDWQSAKEKKSLLHIAAEWGREEVAKVLIAAGAPLDLEDKEGRTPLHQSFDIHRRTGAVYEKAAIAVQLLEAGANPNPKTKWLFSPASSPVIYAMEDVVDCFLKHGVDLAAKHLNGKTLLFDATCFRSIRILRKFIRAGAELDARDDRGRTPLMACIEYDLVRQALTLLKAGATVDLRDEDGNTALHHAAREGKLKVCKALLKYGAEVDARNKEGRTPLDYAAERLDKVRPLAQKAAPDNFWGSETIEWLKNGIAIHELLQKTREDRLEKAFSRALIVSPMRRLSLKPSP
jgi:ankyrin repeat protein